MTGAKILITGANGFVGKHLVRAIINCTDWEVVSLQRHAVPDAESRVRSVYHDFRAPLSEELLAEIGPIDYIIHNGAEVHAIRSLTDPRSFVQSNTVGVFNMLEAARKLKVKKFLYTSSAEVFGAAQPGQAHAEDAPLNPSNPYSAAKAGGEMLVKAYHRSFGLPTLIIRSMNMFGEHQDATKFVPMVVLHAMKSDTLKIHKGQNDNFGSRQWIYITEYIRALLFLLEHGQIGEAYNVAGYELDNMAIVRHVSAILNMEISCAHVLAPKTHDLHYRISDEKYRVRLQDLSSQDTFAEDFKRTVLWLKNHWEKL